MPDFGFHGWFTVLACAVQLAYSVLSFVYGGRSRGLGIPLGLLALTVFGWNFADLAGEHSRQVEWRFLDVTLAPMTSAFTTHFIIGFVGGRRRLRGLLLGVYVAATSLSLVAGTSFFSDWSQAFVLSSTFAVLHASLIAAVGVVCFGLIIQHWRQHRFGLERRRTRLVIIGGIFHAFVGTTELWTGFIEMPRLASFGTLVSMSLWFVVTFRSNLLQRRVSIRLAVYTSIVTSVVVVSYLVLLQSVNASVGALVAGSVIITNGVVVALSRLWVLSSQRRAKFERLAFLGRLTDQMAHDMRNPLSVIIATAHELRHKEAGKTGADAAEETLPSIIIEEGNRISRMIDTYRRIGRIDLKQTQTDLNDLLTQTVKLRRMTRHRAVTVHADLAREALTCSLDPDLITVTFENLLRNAAEAMPEGGEIFLSSRVDDDTAVVVLKDTGHGMDPRTLENCFDEMYSTKETGSGLGLPFARQVVEAHGGSIEAHSAEGEGTEIRVRLPQPSA